MNSNLPSKTAGYTMTAILVILTTAGLCLGAIQPMPEQKNSTLIRNSEGKFSKETTGKGLASPSLRTIPPREEVKPYNAGDVPPSQELMDIIRKVKDSTIPAPFKTETDEEEKASQKALEIIRTEKKALKASEINPSPALEAVLEAYRSGQLPYTRRTLDPEDIDEQNYYHQPYSELNLKSIFDMTVLTSGKDIFLSLGLTPLGLERPSEKDSRSRKIKELRQIVLAFKAKEAREAAELSPDETELQRLRASAKSNIQPRKYMVKQIMDFFGIRRKGDPNQSYEEMTTAFRLYKQWVNRWERMDMYVKKQKARRIQLKRQSPSPAIMREADPFSYGKQIQISPYGYEKIYTAPK